MSPILLAAPLVFPNAPAPDYPGCPLTAVEIAMVGDTMMHGMQLKAARRPDGSYSVEGVFDAVEPYLKAADLAITNLETTTTGEEHHFTGFPRFNSPEALLDALDVAGFDILQTSNNHCLDRGELGVLRTLDAVDRRGFGHSGTYRTWQERQRPWTMHSLEGGLDVAFIGYTFSTNGEAIPRGKPWMVNMLDLGQMDRDVIEARQAGADLVIVGIHWGVEYRDQPEEDMVVLGDRMVAAGADIVMGTHPHVVQPAVVRRASNQYGEERDALVLYSLGNFVSNQRVFRREGAMIARIEVLHCEAQHRTWISDVRLTPTWVDDRLSDGSRGFRVLPTTQTDTCDDLDVSPADCRRQVRHRKHLETLYDPSQFDWDASTTKAKDEVRVGWGFDATGWTPYAPFNYFAAAFIASTSEDEDGSGAP